jgi:hypothetical protein
MNHALTVRALKNRAKPALFLARAISRSVMIERAGNKPSCDEQM